MGLISKKKLLGETGYVDSHICFVRDARSTGCAKYMRTYPREVPG